MIPVRDRPEHPPAGADRLEGHAVPRRRRCLRRARAHKGDRRSRRGPAPRAGRQCGPGAARNAGLGQVTTRLWSPSSTPTACPVRAGSSRCWDTSTTRWSPPSRPGSCPSRWSPPRPCRATRRSAPRWTVGPGRAGPTPQPDPLRAQCRAPRPPRGGRRRPVRSPAARRRGRRSGLAPGRCRMGRPLRTGIDRAARRTGGMWLPGWAGAPSTARRPDLWPAATPSARPSSGLRLVRRRMGTGLRPPARRGGGTPGRVRRRAGPTFQRIGRETGPCGGEDRRRRHAQSGAARAARPHPGLVPRPGARLVLASHPPCRRPGPRRARSGRLAGRPGRTSTLCGTRHCTWPTTWPTALGVWRGCVTARTLRRSAPASCSGPASGPAHHCARSSGPPGEKASRESRRRGRA